MMLWFHRHRRFRDQLSAYIDDALGPSAARRVEAHLGECEGCRTELEQLRSTVAALRELPEAEVPRSFALSPERAAARRPVAPATPLAFGARIAAAGVAAALAAVIVVDLGDLGGDGATEETPSPGMIAERQADEGQLNAERAAPYATPALGEAPVPEVDATETPAADDAAAATREAPEAQSGAALEPSGTPTVGLSGSPQAEGEQGVTPTPSPAPMVPPDATIVPRGAGEVPAPSGLTPEPEAGIKEAVPPSGGGGIDALTAAEIGLAAALGVLIVGSLVLAFAGRKR
jgi:anti-sigma factor RsiW